MKTRLTILDHFFLEGVRALFRFSLAIFERALPSIVARQGDCDSNLLATANAGFIIDKIRQTARQMFNPKELLELKRQIKLPKNELFAVRRSFYLIECKNANARQLQLDATIDKLAKKQRKLSSFSSSSCATLSSSTFEQRAIDEQESARNCKGRPKSDTESEQSEQHSADEDSFECPQVSRLFAFAGELSCPQSARASPTFDALKCNCKHAKLIRLNRQANSGYATSSKSTASGQAMCCQLSARRKSSLALRTSSSSACNLSAPAKLQNGCPSSHRKLGEANFQISQRLCAPVNTQLAPEAHNNKTHRQLQRVIFSENKQKICVQSMQQNASLNRQQPDEASQFCVLDANYLNYGNKFNAPFFNKNNLLAIGVTNDGCSLICARQAARKNLRTLNVETLSCEDCFSHKTATLFVHELRYKLVDGFFLESLNLTIWVCENGELIKQRTDYPALANKHTLGAGLQAAVESVESLSLCDNSSAIFEAKKARQRRRDKKSKLLSKSCFKVKLASLDCATNFLWIYGLEFEPSKVTCADVENENSNRQTMRRRKRKKARKIIVVDLNGFDVYSTFVIDSRVGFWRKVAAFKFNDSRAYLLTLAGDSRDSSDDDTDIEARNSNYFQRTASPHEPEAQVLRNSDPRCKDSSSQISTDSFASEDDEEANNSKFNSSLVSLRVDGKFDCLLSTWHLIDFCCVDRANTRSSESEPSSEQASRETNAQFLVRRLSQLIVGNKPNYASAPLATPSDLRGSALEANRDGAIVASANAKPQQQSNKNKTANNSKPSTNKQALQIVCLFLGNKLSLFEFDSSNSSSPVAVTSREIWLESSEIKARCSRILSAFPVQSLPNYNCSGNNHNSNSNCNDQDNNNEQSSCSSSIEVADGFTRQQQSQQKANATTNQCVVTILTSLGELIKVLI